jgi:WD40 repeat protein
MSEQERCTECGAVLAPEALRKLCPACLLKRGLETQTGGSEAGSAEYVPPTPAELASLFPDLEILELVGRGGMGVVYKARQKHLGRLVALKILLPSVGKDPAFANRFAREARAMAMLSHPHIVAVHDFGQTILPSPQPTAQVPRRGAEGEGEPLSGGLYYFLMEFVDGLDLRRLMDSGKLAAREALAIVPQICDALQYAHDRGVVHRDIKPENVLLDKDGRVKIADFGLAKLVGLETKDFTLTGEGQVMGTPYYMAPEQTEHPEAVDHRADIYSLGVVFYQMLTGELPIGRFAPPSKKVQIDVRLDEVVLRALEKEPERRYQQASEIKSRVDTIAATPPGAASTATPSGAGQRDGIRVAADFSKIAIAAALWAALFLFAAAVLSDACYGVAAAVLLFLGLCPLFGTIVLGCILIIRWVTRAANRPVGGGDAADVNRPKAKQSAADPGARHVSHKADDDAASDSNPKRKRGLFRTLLANASGFDRRTTRLLGTLAMLAFIGISFFAVGFVSPPPDISGNWQGEDWGQVTLTQTAPGEYSGTYTDTVAKEKGPGKIDLKWSRIERRFNGTWREGEGDRFGDLSVHLVGKEIQGALTTSDNSKINPATPRLADFAWTKARENPSPVTSPSGGNEKAMGAPQPGSNDKLAKISSQRIATLEDLVRAVQEKYLSGLARLSDLYDAQDKLLSAQLEAARSKAEQVAIRDKLVKTRQENEKIAGARAKAMAPDAGAQSDLLLARAELQKAEVGLAKAKADDNMPKEGAMEKPDGRPAASLVFAPVIERVTVNSDRAVIEGRASKNDKIVFIFGDKVAMSQTFPSSVHFKFTVEEGEVGDQRGPVARVTETDGKELPDMPAQILPVWEPVFAEPPTDAFTVVRGSLRFRGSATRRPDGTVIVADCWRNPDDSSYAQRVPFGVKLVPAVRKSEKDRTGATVTGRVLTEPGGTGVAGAKVGLCNRMGRFEWTQYAVTAADGTYTFDDVPPGESLRRNRYNAPDYYNYAAWIEAAPDRPPGVWSEAISVPVEQQDVRAHDLYLKYPQSISGTVRDADTGKPIAGAEIFFWSNERGARALTLGPNKNDADAQGRYRLYLRPREVTVSCNGTRDRYNRDDVHGQRIVIAEPQQETTVDFCCESGTPLSGRVLNPDGTPAKDARVRVSVNWPVRVTGGGAGFGGAGGGRGGAGDSARRGGVGGAGRRGSRVGQGAGGGADRLGLRTENWSVSFEATADNEGRFAGYMRQPNLPELQTTLPLSIKARAWLPDHSLGGVGQAEAHVGEPLAQPLVVKLEKTGAAVVRVLFQDGRPVPDAEIRVDGYYPGSHSRLVGQQGKPAEYLGDGRYRIAGLTAGLDYRLRAFRRKLPTRTETGQLAITPGQTTDAGELRLEWEEGLASDAQPRFRIENGSPVALAFSPDGATLASISSPAAANDKTDDAKLIDVANGKVLEAGRIPANCMAFLPKSNRLVLGCRDGTVVLTNEKKLTAWKSFPVSDSDACPLAVSPDGSMIACGVGDGTVGCWDVSTGRKMHTLGAKIPNLRAGPAAIALSPDNKLLVAVYHWGRCTAWDLDSEKELGTFQTLHPDDRFMGGYVHSVSICFCPDGKTAAFAFGYYYGSRRPRNGDSGEDGDKRVQSQLAAELLQFWDPRSGKPAVVVALPKAIEPVFDPDASEDEQVKAPGQTVLSRDCKTAATVLYSGWVAVWDISSRRVFQALPAGDGEGFPLRFRGLAFSPDGRLLATGNPQGVVEVWEIDAAARDAKKSEASASATGGEGAVVPK